MAESPEFWFHKPKERMWAIEVRDGAVVGACGPMAVEDASPDILEYLPLDSRDLPVDQRMP
jgi:hypothetical protein